MFDLMFRKMCFVFKYKNCISDLNLFRQRFHDFVVRFSFRFGQCNDVEYCTKHTTRTKHEHAVVSTQCFRQNGIECDKNKR